MCAAAIPALLADGAGTKAAASALDRLKALYTRPGHIPFPAANPYSPEKAALGEKLFFDPSLSGNDTLACAGCHMPSHGFEDGRKLGRGSQGKALSRHTPTLWDLAWGETFFWDGRAGTLEEQARTPIEHADEMNQPMTVLVEELRSDPAYRAGFADAFPEEPEISERNVLKALATFVRTLVPSPTRFDRWIDGDENALSLQEKLGFLVFNGKGRCAACHTGFDFTDHAFHDIGLPDDDPGRGAILGVPAASHAFKTPTLADIADRAPYMHDGSLPDLEAVIAHYEAGIVERPTLSPDIEPVRLTDEEKGNLIAFLQTLDVRESLPASEVASRAGPPQRPEVEAEPVATQTIEQKNLAFSPLSVRVEAGETVTVVNRDSRTHTVDVNAPDYRFSSGANRPGDSVEMTFPAPGEYTVICSIHPTMRLRVHAE